MFVFCKKDNKIEIAETASEPQSQPVTPCNGITDHSGNYVVNVKLYYSITQYSPGPNFTPIGQTTWDSTYVDTFHVIRLNNAYSYSIAHYPKSVFSNPNKITKTFNMVKMADGNDTCITAAYYGEGGYYNTVLLAHDTLISRNQWMGSKSYYGNEMHGKRIN